MSRKNPLIFLGPELDKKEIREFFRIYSASTKTAAKVAIKNFSKNTSKVKKLSIVAVDKGYKHVPIFVQIALEYGFICELDFAIGDWDSLGFTPPEKVSSALQFQNIFTLPVYKNESDLAAALRRIQKDGRDFTACILLGFQGGRMDHHYAVIHDVNPFVKTYPVFSWGREGVMIFGGKIGRLDLQSTRKDSLVSVFPMHTVLTGVKVTGLRFSPARGILKPGSHGLSNLTNGGRIQIRWKTGRILVLFPDRSSVKVPA